MPISSSQTQAYALLPSSSAFREEQARLFLRKADIELPDQRLATLRERHNEVCLRNLSVVKDICRRFFTDDFQVVPLLEMGTFYAVYRVEIGSNPCYYLRANLLLDTPAFAFLFDVWAEHYLPHRGVPIVPVIAVELGNSTPYNYMISCAALGRPLKHYEDPQTQAINPSLLVALGRTVAHIHTLSGENYGLLDIAFLQEAADKPRGSKVTWSDYLFLHLEDHLNLCKDVGVLSSQDAQFCLHLFHHEASTTLQEVASHLLHGDLGHHNIVTDGEQITAVLDWEDALCGDPIFDIAGWGTFTKDWMREPFLEGYTSVHKLPPDFEWRYWLYYLRIALAKTVHRIRFDIKDPPHRQPAYLRIQKALEHLRRMS